MEENEIKLVPYPIPDNDTVKAGRLATKLARIVKKIGYVQKTGHNKEQNYKYATEADLLSAVRDAIAEENVAIIPRVLGQTRTAAHETKYGVKQYFTDVSVQFDIIDGDTGYRESVTFPGCGIDFNDKGGYKAITGAQKYFLSKTFLVPTGDDPEKDDETQPLVDVLAKTSAVTAPAPGKSAPKVDHTPAEGKDEPRPEKKPFDQYVKDTLSEAETSKALKKSEKDLKSAVSDTGKPKVITSVPGSTTQDRLPKGAEINLYLDRLKPYRDKLGVGSDGSKALNAWLLKTSGATKSQEITIKHWESMLLILESAKTKEALIKLVGA